MPLVILVANPGAINYNASLSVIHPTTNGLDLLQCYFPGVYLASGPDSVESDMKRHQPHWYLFSTPYATPHPESSAKMK